LTRLSFFKAFQDALKVHAPAIAAKKAQRNQSPLSEWKPADIADHLSAADWQSHNAEVTKYIEQHNDRGVAITSMSMVEDRLKWMIERSFIANLSDKRRKWIFGEKGPLGSFESRVQLAYAIGLIGDGVRGNVCRPGAQNRKGVTGCKQRWPNQSHAKWDSEEQE